MFWIGVLLTVIVVLELKQMATFQESVDVLNEVSANLSEVKDKILAIFQLVQDLKNGGAGNVTQEQLDNLFALAIAVKDGVQAVEDTEDSTLA